MSTPYKRCPRCHAPAHLETEQCYQCGHKFRTRFVPGPDRTQAYGLEETPGGAARLAGETAARPFLISVMWLLVALGVALWKTSPDMTAVANLGAVAIAIYLISSRARADRISGSIMLALQCVAVALFCWKYFTRK
jgi:hypothetical protein